MKLDGTIAAMHEKWFGIKPAPGSAAVTVFPGYGVPGMAGYDPTEHTPECNSVLADVARRPDADFDPVPG